MNNHVQSQGYFLLLTPGPGLYFAIYYLAQAKMRKGLWLVTLFKTVTWSEDVFPEEEVLRDLDAEVAEPDLVDAAQQFEAVVGAAGVLK